MAEDQRIEDLTRKAVDDLAELGRRTRDLAREELVEAGKRAAWPTVIAAAGGLMASVGICGLMLSPALLDPGPIRRLALGYLVVGGAGVIGGLLGLGREATHALPRTRGAAETAIESVREHAPQPG